MISAEAILNAGTSREYKRSVLSLSNGVDRLGSDISKLTTGAGVWREELVQEKSQKQPTSNK